MLAERSNGRPNNLATILGAVIFGIIQMKSKPDELWRCDKCGRGFANKHQSHFCSDVTLESHFERYPPETRKLYEAFLAVVQSFGPVLVLPEKTRIAFQVRMSFAALMTRRGYLRGHLVLAGEMRIHAFPRSKRSHREITCMLSSCAMWTN